MLLQCPENRVIFPQGKPWLLSFWYIFTFSLSKKDSLPTFSHFPDQYTFPSWNYFNSIFCISLLFRNQTIDVMSCLKFVHGNFRVWICVMDVLIWQKLFPMISVYEITSFLALSLKFHHFSRFFRTQILTPTFLSFPEFGQTFYYKVYRKCISGTLLVDII